jgi:hypothetical protein
MQGEIGLEEHFAIAETLADSGVFLPDRCWGELSRRLLDVQKERTALKIGRRNAIRLFKLELK